MSESTSYNLRSNKTDPIQVPIQLQLNNDTDFLSQLLQTNNQAQQLTAGESDSSDESHLNCSGIIKNSDGEKTGEQETVTFDNADETAPDNAAVQQMINSQILSQLQTISHRLDKIEQTHTKKTNDPKKVKFSKKKSKLALTSTCCFKANPTTNLATESTTTSTVAYYKTRSFDSGPSREKAKRISRSGKIRYTKAKIIARWSRRSACT